MNETKYFLKGDIIFRSSRLELLYKKRFLKNTWAGVSFWMKLQVFSCKFSKNNFFAEVNELQVNECLFYVVAEN